MHSGHDTIGGSSGRYREEETLGRVYVRAQGEGSDKRDRVGRESNRIGGRRCVSSLERILPSFPSRNRPNFCYLPRNGNHEFPASVIISSGEGIGWKIPPDIHIYIHIVLIRVLNTKYSWGGEGRVKERERKRKKKESTRNERKNMRGGREPSIGPMTGAFACDQVESRGSRFRVPPPRF